jgi:PIN domain
MLASRLRLRDGLTAERPIAVIEDLISEARGLNTWMQRNNVELFRDKYLDWAEAVESQLVTFTTDPAAVATLHTDRYWHIRTLTSGSAQAFSVIRAERDAQISTLRAWATELRERQARFGGAGALAVVVDTNVLLEFLPPDQIPWPDLLRIDTVRLIVPLRVVEELDMKKYSNSKRLAERARALLPQLEGWVRPTGESGQLRAGATIEVLIEPGDRRRPDDADQEILSACLDLGQYGGSKPRLVTGDTAMRLRAGALGIDVTGLPDQYRRPSPLPAGP